MSERKIKSCPFNQDACTAECALFIGPEDLNELLEARLASLGILNKESGTCSLKILSMSAGRFIFENTSTKRF